MRPLIKTTLLAIFGTLSLTTFSQAVLLPRASTQFTDYLAGRSYEADVLPNANTGAPFIREAAGTIAAESVSGGILTFRTENTGGNTLYWKGDSAAGPSWWTSNADPTKGYTVEFRLQALTGAYDFAFVATYDNTDANYRVLTIEDKAIKWGNTVLSTAANDDTFHVFRLVNLPNSNVYQLWRDDVLISDNLLGTGVVQNRFWFGDWSGDPGGAKLDYLRWDTSGAYAPVPEPSTLAFGAVVMLFGCAKWQRAAGRRHALTTLRS